MKRLGSPWRKSAGIRARSLPERGRTLHPAWTSSLRSPNIPDIRALRLIASRAHRSWPEARLSRSLCCGGLSPQTASSRGTALIFATWVLTCGSVVFAQSASPEAKGESRLEAGLAFAQTLGSTSFNTTQTVREFAENGTLRSAYKIGGARGGGVHLQYNLRPRFALRLGFHTFSRKSTGTFEAEVPHPFFLGRPRTVTGTQAGLGFHESAYSLTGAYRGGSGRWRWSVDGGPAVFAVSATVAEKVAYGHVFPYDTATFSGITSTRKKAAPIGVAAGVELVRDLSPSISVLAQARFNRGSGNLDVNGQKISIKSGGAQARFGLRFVLLRR